MTENPTQIQYLLVRDSITIEPDFEVDYGFVFIK
jgi:hypothetical protein